MSVAEESAVRRVRWQAEEEEEEYEPDEIPDEFSELQMLMDQLGRLSHAPGRETSQGLSVKLQIAGCLTKMGRVPDAIPYLREVVEGRVAFFGSMQLHETNEARTALALLLHIQGHYSEVEPLLSQAVRSIHRKVCEKRGYCCVGCSTAKCNLGLLLFAQGDAHDAERPLREALEARRANDAVGPNHDDTLLSMAMLGEALRSSGQTSEAIAMFNEELELHSVKAYARGMRDIDAELVCLENLMGAYGEKGDEPSGQARAARRHEVVMQEKFPGRDSVAM